MQIGSNIERVLDDIPLRADEKFQDYLEKYTLRDVMKKL
jgi:hypothetical protein